MTRNLVFLVFDRFQILDLTGPMAAFEIASRFVDGAYALTTVSQGGGLVAASSGLAVMTEAFADQPCDTLVVAGGEGTLEAGRDTRMRDFVLTRSAMARRTPSVCSGAAILALAGLLDGRRATTHWRRAPSFQKYFPKVQVE